MRGEKNYKSTLDVRKKIGDGFTLIWQMAESKMRNRSSMLAEFGGKGER